MQPACIISLTNMQMAPMWHIQDGQDGRGRRVIADKGLKAGDVVLEDDAAAWCLISDRLSQFCDCCLAPIERPLRCAGISLLITTAPPASGGIEAPSCIHTVAANRRCRPQVLRLQDSLLP
jgi:hypothetical protein